MMFIQTEDTPNQNAMKFLPGIFISKDRTLFFNTAQEAHGKSNLAVKLFQISFVKAVFFGTDFITITKEESIEWDMVKPEILMVIMDYILSGSPILEKVQKQNINSDKIKQNNFKNLTEIERKIVDIIETRVRPAVAMDGGDIIYNKFEDGIVFLELHGACSGCPSSTITLKQGIESMLQHFVPEVKRVEAINGL